MYFLFQNLFFKLSTVLVAIHIFLVGKFIWKYFYVTGTSTGTCRETMLLQYLFILLLQVPTWTCPNYNTLILSLWCNVYNLCENHSSSLFWICDVIQCICIVGSTVIIIFLTASPDINLHRSVGHISNDFCDFFWISVNMCPFKKLNIPLKKVKVCV